MDAPRRTPFRGDRVADDFSDHLGSQEPGRSARCGQRQPAHPASTRRIARGSQIPSSRRSRARSGSPGERLPTASAVACTPQRIVHPSRLVAGFILVRTVSATPPGKSVASHAPAAQVGQRSHGVPHSRQPPARRLFHRRLAALPDLPAGAPFAVGLADGRAGNRRRQLELPSEGRPRSAPTSGRSVTVFRRIPVGRFGDPSGRHAIHAPSGSTRIRTAAPGLRAATISDLCASARPSLALDCRATAATASATASSSEPASESGFFSVPGRRPALVVPRRAQRPFFGQLAWIRVGRQSSFFRQRPLATASVPAFAARARHPLGNFLRPCGTCRSSERSSCPQRHRMVGSDHGHADPPGTGTSPTSQSLLVRRPPGSNASASGTTLRSLGDGQLVRWPARLPASPSGRSGGSVEHIRSFAFGIG